MKALFFFVSTRCLKIHKKERTGGGGKGWKEKMSNLYPKGNNQFFFVAMVFCCCFFFIQGKMVGKREGEEGLSDLGGNG